MKIVKMPKKIVLFDGVCNLCNTAVQFILKRDKKAQIHFAALQSEAGQALMQEFGLEKASLDSFIFIDEGKAYIKAAASLQLSRYLTGAWPSLQFFKIIPKFISNGVYDFIAKNRYSWFGRRAECMLPTPALKERFLS